jgi:hypothetical protein
MRCWCFIGFFSSELISVVMGAAQLFYLNFLGCLGAVEIFMVGICMVFNGF